MKTSRHLIQSYLFLALSLFIFKPAHAAEILAIVSPSNAADALHGAYQLLKERPDYKINLRTTKQFMQLDRQQQQALWRKADFVFAGAVFGDTAIQMHNLIPFSKGFIAVHSDYNLIRQSHLNNKPLMKNADIKKLMQHPPVEADANQFMHEKLKNNPQYKDWLLAKSFWAGRNGESFAALFRHLNKLSGESITVPEPKAISPIRIWQAGIRYELDDFKITGNKPALVIIDYETGDRPGEESLLKQICQQASQFNCFAILARWGEASLLATQWLNKHKANIKALVSLQNFVIGGGEGRQSVNKELAKLKLPVLKGIRITDTGKVAWELSEQGLSWDSVHYRVAMPELQGVSQPLVLAAMQKGKLDELTGLLISQSQPIKTQVKWLLQRLNRWLALAEKANKDKKLAIIYYNHPPGRHNIGADNLNVPASLFEILKRLQSEGYNTGVLPESEKELLDLLQQRGVNLPENNAALAKMAKQITTVSAQQYQQWFEQLSPALQAEMQNGPLAYLHQLIQQAKQLDDKKIATQLSHRVIEDLRHILEGSEHKNRERASKLLEQLDALYQQETVNWKEAERLVLAISKTGVEGFGGWGELPGQVMVHNGQIVLPGLIFGNIFVGPQPPRGWEINEELIHANLSFPPPHQYLAFYQWLRNEFKTDALVHLGRHSTYEFLPRHRVGISDSDYPSALIADIPSIYPYIVDGVGEGIQAKRRGLAVMIDHLTPPLDSTRLYDELLILRQLVESYEAAPESAQAMRQRAINTIKTKVDELKLRDELMASMSGELKARGITSFEQVDDELLVHEVGHYLTHLQEDFMPLGLHIYGKNWSDKAIDIMVNSMAQSDPRAADKKTWANLLKASPTAEMQAFFNALNGQYVLPGKGNDPIKTPEVLPTGRNFFALDGSLIPSRLGYSVGLELAEKVRAEKAGKHTAVNDKKGEAIVLWASDVVRDEGALIGFGMDLLGLKPVWNSRGIFKGLERLNLQPSRQRHDVMFTTSGLFRDLYGAQLIWLERAVLMALDASSDTIRKDYPALKFALNSSLEKLGKLQNPDSEPLQQNLLAQRWVNDTRAQLRAGVDAKTAGIESAYRVFGTAPGSYGAGVNKMVERSGSWQQRQQVAATFIHRMGHVYGQGLSGQPSHKLFKQRLRQISKSYLGRASNLYGLIDNNDAFDYLGGLSLAVETESGTAPENFILSHADSKNIQIQPLELALLGELRGRFLNPQWLKPLMDEGYAGARTMGSEFLEYLWGWQVTNPGIVKSWVWDEVKAVYIDDKHQLELDTFLEQDNNVYVKTNMLAIMLVAAEKGFWEASNEDLQQIAEAFSSLVINNGLPGSGHTSPNHPMFDWIEQYIEPQQYQQLQEVLKKARQNYSTSDSPSTISEIELDDNSSSAKQAKANTPSTDKQQSNDKIGSLRQYWLFAVLGILLAGGLYLGSRSPGKST